jgi:hypothetical protein
MLRQKKRKRKGAQYIPAKTMKYSISVLTPGRGPCNLAIGRASTFSTGSTDIAAMSGWHWVFLILRHTKRVFDCTACIVDIIELGLNLLIRLLPLRPFFLHPFTPQKVSSHLLHLAVTLGGMSVLGNSLHG